MDRESLEKTAHARLYPSVRNPNYLVLRSRRLIFRTYSQSLPNDLVVLDVGGRYQPYRPLLAGKITKYIALDVQKTDLVSTVGSGECIPFRDATFDLVIATCVFEYFQSPQDAADEIYRVLKPGGSLFASFGAVVPRFLDQERWRFLPLGLQTLFSKFSRIGVVPEVSSLGGFCRLINLGLHDFLKLRPLKFAYELTACPLLNLLGLGLEGARLTPNDKWTGNYSLTAVK
jgi:SAM-dependent methyltransferase